MKIIIWNMKHSVRVFDASSEVAELSSYLKIFNEMLDMGYFDCNPPEKGLQKKFFNAARKGNRVAARLFISLRKQYEYEFTELVEVE